ncbi:aldose epimerase family protein [Nocardioides caeni]|uniref:aldose epimerase family protein n=1 Tax=Nocardioides caeni TaxID=574700 RepID=UPI00130509A6|nr:aldose epimerase family protein [Nocardioides caeni]
MNQTPLGAIVIGRAPGPELHVLPVGATVQRLLVTCGDGVRRDLVLGLADGDAVRSGTDYVGSIVGRYANRIAHGRFVLDGAQHELPVNDRGHHLHGGPDGFHTRTWDVVEHTADELALELVSPDGDAGYPGQLTVRATYRVEGDIVHLDIAATTTAPTIVNLTSHAYFNLHGAGTIDDHRLRVDASRYTPVDEESIPTGGHARVEGTPFDLRAPTRLGDVVRADHPQVRDSRGIDHNLVLDGTGWRTVAVLDGPITRTRMELWSNQPGLQVYTGNFLAGTATDHAGRMLRQGDGLCLEPQLAPDAPNRGSADGTMDPDWPSAVLRPGETYVNRMAWLFSSLA